jgi:hypothetical protein
MEIHIGSASRTLNRVVTIRKYFKLQRKKNGCIKITKASNPVRKLKEFNLLSIFRITGLLGIVSRPNF